MFDVYPSREEVPVILRYDTTTIVLHWVTAALVGVLWIIGQTMDIAPKGVLRDDYRSLHIVLGLLLAALLLFRLAWRITRGLTLPPDRHRLLAAFAKATHWCLYLLLLATILLGILRAWSNGDAIFNLFQFSSFGDRPLRHAIGGWHALTANAVLILAGLHAAAALSHHYVLRDQMLARMVPFLRTSAE
jgi:cytochrome b561